MYGRKPVLEALQDPRSTFDKIVVARTARGDVIDEILDLAGARGVRIERADASRVTRISRNGRHDQGVVADLVSPGLAALESWLPDHDGSLSTVLLDGLTNPANVGMIIRTAAGAGLDAVVLPVAGSPEVGPLVVKASAGVALWAPIVRAPTAEEAAQRLSQAGVALVGLASGDHPPVWSAALPDRVALVLGNETSGISPAVSDLVASWCSIPTAAGVESLNVAAAAAVVCFELVRRRATFSA